MGEKKRVEQDLGNNEHLHGEKSIKCFNETLIIHQWVAVYVMPLSDVCYWLTMLSPWGEELSG